MGIRKDMAEGDVAEQKVIALFQKHGFAASKNNDTKTRKFWDIETNRDGLELTIEVKNDKYANKSGNIALEFYNPKSGKDSGLAVTQADLWIVMVNDELWLAETLMLKAFVEKNKPCRIVSTAGDGNASLYLYDKDRLFDVIFSRVDNIDDRNTFNMLLFKIGVPHEPTKMV